MCGRGDSKEVDAGEYCSFSTYFNLWKRDFPELKVSRPVEDICKDCYAFANHTGILQITQWDATMMMAMATSTATVMATAMATAMANVAMTDAASSNDGKNDDGSNGVSNVGVRPITNIDLNRPEAVSMKVDKEREQLLLQAAAHIKNGKGTESPLPGQGGGCGCRCNCRERTLGKKIYFCC